MSFFSVKTIIEVLAGIWINLTSAWFGILVVAPGIFEVKSPEEYKRLLTINLPLAIVGLIASLFFVDKKNQYDKR